MGRKLGLLTSTALTTSTALLSGAVAADLRMPVKAPPLAPVYSWNGCYIGVNVGAVSVRLRQRIEIAGFDDIETNGRDEGFIGGGQIGCNYLYSPNWLVGVEGDINFVDISRRRAFDFTVFGEDVTGSHATKLHWLATLRGRLGPVWDRTLVYVTGGLAIGQARSRVSAVEEFGGTYSGSESDTRAGWTFGAGIEHAFSNKISAKLEYLHFDLGRERFNVNLVSGAGFVTTFRATSKVSGDIVRIGLNYKFN